MRPTPGRPWVIAHRGASAAFPENTVEAFRGAAALGADAVELDVRPAADGALLVHHDAAVPGLGPLAAHSAAYWRRRAPWVPTLAEALEACGGLWVDVEVKSPSADGVVAAVVSLLRVTGRMESMLLTSVDPVTVARARRLAPGLPTGLLVEADRPLRPALAAAAAAGHAALAPHASALAGDAAHSAVAAAHAGGMQLLAWTVNDPAEGRRLAAAGVDGIITNRPDALLSEFGEDRHHYGG